MTTKAICSVCNRYKTCRNIVDPAEAKGNPWVCVESRKCSKEAYG